MIVYLMDKIFIEDIKRFIYGFYGWVYFLNILDANIDAHLLDYNVNENLSLKPYFENDNLTNSSSIGLKLKLSL